MTDRLKGFTVVLESDLRPEDAAPLMDAINQMRGVAAVVGVETLPGDYWARLSVRHTLRDELISAIEAKLTMTRY